MAVVTTRESSMNRDRINETQNDVNVSSSPPAAEAILTLLRCLKFDAGALNEDRQTVKTSTRMLLKLTRKSNIWLFLSDLNGTTRLEVPV